MGGWIALRMAQELTAAGESDRLHGMLLIAPAPDFTHELMWPALSEEQRRLIEAGGTLEEPSQYSDEPNIYTAALFTDGEMNRVMTGPLETGCPVHILQGMNDPDVPWRHAMKLTEFLPSEEVVMTLVKDGDHRMSRPSDIDLMLRLAGSLAA
jgi:pimeloyl-ACP methyl ester carboxylesterase